MTLNTYSTQFRINQSVRAMRLIMPDVLLEESKISASKWFGYRFMTPLEATRLFADLYRKGLKTYVRTHRDVDEANRSSGISAAIFDHPSGDLTQLWRARQRADSFRLPYDLLIEFGFHFAGRRRWKHAPRPIQLFGSAKSGVAWAAEIEKFLAERLPSAALRLEGLPQYRVENYRGYRVQDDFREHILALLQVPGSPWAVKLSSQCIVRRHISLEQALEIVPESMRTGVHAGIRDDVETGILTPAEQTRLPKIAFTPSCFGLPPARDLLGAVCASCEFSNSCSLLAASTEREMMDRYGDLSPVKTDRLKKNRKATNLRVQKHRKNKASASAKASPCAGSSLM